MTTEETGAESLEERANRLYWESDRSVNQIAEDLEMSKGALYDVVSPRPAGLACPHCGHEMGYSNRTARDRGFVTCPDCGLEEEEARLGGPAREGRSPAGGGAPVVAPRALRKARRGSGWDPLTRVVAAAGLLGVAAGITLAAILRRK